MEHRILVLAPRGRDAQVIGQVLSLFDVHNDLCSDYQHLLACIKEGAGAAMVSEEALIDADLSKLEEWQSQQESWSDFPFILLVSSRFSELSVASRDLLKALHNVVLLERPLKAETLRRAAASALRARKRQYQARRDLRAKTHSEERLRIALQAGQLGSWNLDLKTRHLDASAECKANFGRQADESLSYLDLLDCIHPEDRVQKVPVLRAAIGERRGFDIECRIIWPDGSLHWVQVQGMTSCDAGGDPTLMVGVSKDVTDRVEAEQRLKQSQNALRNLNETLENRIEERTAALAQANDRLMHEMTERERAQSALIQTQKMEAIGQLTGGIAHDFNNLLSVIQGNIELIDLLSTDERIRNMADAARKASERGAKLTTQLLAFARNQRLDLQALDLSATLEGIRELLAASTGPSVDIRVDLPTGMPLVQADPNQIELAILNLVINARDAMPDGGTIMIWAEVREALPDVLTNGEYAVISISDSGEGINPEVIAKVFDPFFTTKAVGKGTGLGLSQVYGIAKQSGGTARIFSEVDVGTTVEIWLPLSDAKRSVDSSEHLVFSEKIGSGRARVLVVEDDAAVRQFIVECLEILGYRVTQADNGINALALLSKSRPDLMITDFLMPGMTGAQLMAEAASIFPDMPVIIATGYADMDAVEKVIGDNTILHKPFQINGLATAVGRALRTASLKLADDEIESPGLVLTRSDAADS